MRALTLSLFILAAGVAGPHPAAHAARPPVLGTWQFVGTSPPGVVRQGTQVALITLTQHGKTLHALVLTGRHRHDAEEDVAA